MGDENPIRTLGDYSKPSHEGYRITIELPDRNNVVPLRSDTIQLVQNGCSFHGLHERKHLRLFQFSLRDQASNWLERLPTTSISTWEDLTTRFLAQFFPPGRTEKLQNDILMFQQHQGESLPEACTRFKDLLQKSIIMASIFGSKSNFFMILSLSILSAKLTAPSAANSMTRTLRNLGKSYRIPLFMTMRAGMIQETSSNRSRQFHCLQYIKDT
ncbi:zinc finger, CCHC-type containing protein [Tanacetum coccineum]